MRIAFKCGRGAAFTAIAFAMLISTAVTPVASPAETLPAQISDADFGFAV